MNKKIMDKINKFFIESLKKVVGPWHKPWDPFHPTNQNPFPCNAVSNRRYTGVNIAILWASAV